MSSSAPEGEGGGNSGEEAAPPPPHILVFPFPAQGHMIPLLDFAHILSLRGLSVTVLVTPKNAPLLQPLLSRSPAVSPLVLPFPSHSSLPAGVENTQGLPPSSFFAMMGALAGLRGPLLRWARSAPRPPDALISDFFLGWTRAAAAELRIPRLVFCPSGAATLSIVHCLWRQMPPRPPGGSDEAPLAFPSLPGAPVYAWYQLSPTFQAFREGDELCEFVRRGFLENISSWGYVFNSFTAAEAAHLRHLRADLGHHRVWAVGPLLPPDDAADRGGGDGNGDGDGVLAWLGGRAEGSVVYVCFGSHTKLTAAQAAAVGAALERSGAGFVWSLRGAEPPAEFEERTAGKGVVVRGWAPQVAILSHPAVGSFLTHCGWNSVMEGIVAGVALLMWPMTADQFYNARLLGELRIGIRACERADAVPDPDDLARVMAGSVDGSGSPMRARALELRREAAEATREGGDSHRQISELVDELRRLKRRPL
ncbi:unnamed protein product [Spirodela intermedia]|uniref:Uncharacterized protein n=1 Tax=Spirodela intermedia TaxID=51605 RepID=A0A7I8KL66_SPIIN|nr:unnamed protein product [Spirodela intermedia]